MADLLRTAWLQTQLLDLLDTAETTRIPFRAKRYLQARTFHNYRFMNGTEELHPHELISADVSDKYCNIRCSFTRALEARLQKEKGWRLTELRGSILAKATGVLCIVENPSTNGLSVVLEIDSFVPHGDAGGAVYGEPVWFDNLPEVRTMLNKHHILKLVGPLNTDLCEIRSQASEQSSDENSEGESSQMLTQPVSARDRSTKHIHLRKENRNEGMTDLISIKPGNAKRRRLHTGWADFRDLTYYDCQIPPAQQRILDDEACWMPRGEYAIEPIKHKSRRKQSTAPETGPKQTRLSIEDLQPKSEGLETLDDIEHKSEDDHDDNDDDQISWAESPEPMTTKERTFIFNAEQLDRIRRQQVDHSPPPDSSPLSVVAVPAANPALIDNAAEARRAVAKSSPLEVTEPSLQNPLLSAGELLAVTDTTSHTDDHDWHPSDSVLDLQAAQRVEHHSETGEAPVDVATPQPSGLEAMNAVSNSLKATIGSSPVVCQVPVGQTISLVSPGNMNSSPGLLEEIDTKSRDQVAIFDSCSGSFEAPSVPQPVSSPQLVSVSNESSPRSTQELPAPSSLIPSPQAVTRTRTIPWMRSASGTAIKAISPKEQTPVLNKPFISPYDIAARKSSQSPQAIPQSSRPWQQTSSYRFAHASSRSSNGSPGRISDTRATSTHRRPSKAELSRLVYAARAPSQELSSTLRKTHRSPQLTRGNVAGVVKDTSQRRSINSRGSSPLRPRSAKTRPGAILSSQNQSLNGTHAQDRKMSKVRKFDLSKLQQQNDGGLDVQDLLDRHRATYLRYRQPPPTTHDGTTTPQTAAIFSSPSRKRKADEIEETQVNEPATYETSNSSDDEIFDVLKQSDTPWYEDPDTPLRKVLNTTLKPRNPESGWHVTSWRDTLDALDRRNRERGV